MLGRSGAWYDSVLSTPRLKRSMLDGWGALKWAVNLLAGIFAFGWTCNSPAHILSTVDGSHQWITVSPNAPPKMVRVYNAYMQGIDHHNQLRMTFLLTKRRGFKKWYVKMWLALIDIALTNASIC
jgi:hypothetical protein